MARNVSNDDDIYSEVDSEEFVQDMRAYGVGQAISLEEEGMDADAAAYLRAVRAEASRIPHVTVSTRLHPEPSAPQAPSDTLPETLAPPYEWTCTVIDNFLSARTQVQVDIASKAPPECSARLPHASDRRSWQRLIHQESFQPFSTTLARMDNNLAGNCLGALAEECQHEEALSSHAGIWMYGLMVRLEKPVHPSVACVLRQVAVIARDRRQLLGAEIAAAASEAAESRAETVGRASYGREEGDVHEPGDEEAVEGGSGGEEQGGMAQGVPQQVAMFDTLRVLAGGFFGQDAHMAPLVDDYLSRTQPVQT